MSINFRKIVKIKAGTDLIENIQGPQAIVILPNSSRSIDLKDDDDFLFSWKRFEEGAWIDLDENQPVKECKYIVINGPDKIEYLQVVLFLLYF